MQEMPNVDNATMRKVDPDDGSVLKEYPNRIRLAHVKVGNKPFYSANPDHVGHLRTVTQILQSDMHTYFIFCEHGSVYCIEIPQESTQPENQLRQHQRREVDGTLNS